MTKIDFLIPGKQPLTFDCETLKEAVEQAVKRDADLCGANLYGAKLYGADLENAYLEGAELEGACLRCAYIEAADLEGANLIAADLRGADLRGADLRGADLRGADLEGAELEGANLIAADLEGADLEGADLRGADLRGADLEGAELEGAKYGDRKLWSIRPVLQLGCCGSIGRTTLVFLFADGGSPLVKCGCFSGDVDKFEAKIHATHRGTFYEAEYMAMVAHIRAIHALQKE